ncbi:MAG: ABC transporter permease [bacterium]
MILIKLAWRNIWRNPRRTLISIAAIVFGTSILIFAVSLQLGAYEEMINRALGIHTGHVQVQAVGYQAKKDIRQVIREPDRVTEGLSHIPEIEAFSYRANAFSLVSSTRQTYSSLIIGIDPIRERRVSTMARVMRRGRYLSEEDTDKALIGELLAGSLEVDIGDELTVLGHGFDGSIAAGLVSIKGIFRSGDAEFDRASMIIPLRAFQNMYGLGSSVHEVVIKSRRLVRLSNLIKVLTRRLARSTPAQPLAVLSWPQLMPGLEQAIKIDMVNGWIFYTILVVIVCLSIMNTLFMSIMERTKEFGMLLAVGMSHRRIVGLVLLESVFMTAAGVVLGVLSGSLFTYYFQIHGLELSGYGELFAQWGMSSILTPRLSLISTLLVPSLIFLITLLMLCFPLLKLHRLTPTRAMRAI